MKKSILNLFLILALTMQAQQPLSIEKLWQLKRVATLGISPDGNAVLYTVSMPDIQQNSFQTSYFKMDIDSRKSQEISKEEMQKLTQKIAPSGKQILVHKPVKILKTFAHDFYQDLEKSSGKIYESMDYRHWDKWRDGNFSHVFIQDVNDENHLQDIMQGLPYYCPQEPFGSDEDYLWHPSGEKVLYVTKAKTGNDYVKSTNTDIYEYDIQTQQTRNLTEGMFGYDTRPSFSTQGVLAWLSMQTDGNEADKNNLYLLLNGERKNITQNWDHTILDYRWNVNGKSLFCVIAKDGTKQLFELFPFGKELKTKELAKGDFDIDGIVGQKGNTLVLTRTDMNHAREIYAINLKNNKLYPLTEVNKSLYQNVAQCKTEKRYITTTDGKKMLTWVIYPPDFNPKKKYPTLLYCQGGPQSALTQFYSFRWNFQLIASQGYIVIAPNRRGMPGYGEAWNAEISGDWGGQPIRDYLSAADALAQEPFVDKTRMGAIGASYGGYSVFYLAGVHQGRFKTFISHCGVFNLQSMYGTTEEKFFVNNELGGAYWLKDNPTAQRSYTEFNPINFVNQWDSPILIIQGGKDYRVPEEQAFQAFTAAQTKGIKSKFLYFPDENHWILQPQNALFWQRTFFEWLEETLR